MSVKMLGCEQSAGVSVCGRLDDDRDERHLAMGDAALGDHRLGKFPYRRGVATQHGDFETALMIEMNMQGRNLQLVMCVMRRGQPFGEFAGMMVEDIGKG